MKPWLSWDSEFYCLLLHRVPLTVPTICFGIQSGINYIVFIFQTLWFSSQVLSFNHLYLYYLNIWNAVIEKGGKVGKERWRREKRKKEENKTAVDPVSQKQIFLDDLNFSDILRFGVT